jgi:hypothetical protein
MSHTGVTLNKLIQEIETLSNAHEMLNSFHYGEFLDIYQSGKIIYYTLLMNVNNATLDDHYITLNIEFMVMDKVFKDESSLNDVESDTLQILTDIYSVITTSIKWQSFSKVAAATPMRKFIGKGEDQVTGWAQTVQLKIKRKNGLCDLPIVDYDYDGEYTPSCQGVKISEDGIYIKTVESGGKFNYSTSCLQTELLVNGIPFISVDSGDNYNLNVINLDGDHTGVKMGDNWVVPISEKIYYNRAWYLDDVIIELYDEGWWIVNGINDYNEAIPTGAKKQQINNEIGLVDKLIYNNIHHHKFRFTGVNGGYYDHSDLNYYTKDGVISTKLVEFPIYEGSRFFIIDHLTGYMWIGIRLGATTQLSTLTFVNDLVQDGYNDWKVPSLGTGMQLMDNRYIPNLYSISRLPWEYNQPAYWTCTNATYQPMNRAFFINGYNVISYNMKSGSSSNKWCFREHLTGTIN